MPALTLTDSWIKALRFDREINKISRATTPTQIDYFATLRPGLQIILTLTSTENKIWSTQFYQHGRPKRKKIGLYNFATDRFPKLSAREVQEVASKFDVKKALEEGLPDTFEAVAEDWLVRHVDARGLRTAKEIRRHLKVYIYPAWRTRKFVEIKRIDVNRLLDKIADERGKRMADAILTTLRSMASWYQTRDGDYVSPYVRGMKRDTRRVEEKTRDRILSDDEIKAVWEATKSCGQFGDIVRLCLLTGQRREKVATIRWQDIDDDGVWTIDVAPGEKNTAGSLRLPQMALDIVESQDRLADCDYVFWSPRGRKRDCFNAWSKSMEALRALLPKTEHFVVHDFRRTNRSLMARLGVADPVAEKVLGHALTGVLAIYNRYDYDDEKAAALQAVADHIAGLLPSSPRVVGLPAKAKRKAKAA